MAYITEAEYLDLTANENAPCDFAVYAEASSAIIDNLTMGKLSAGVETFPATTQTAIKKAVAAEIDCLLNNGGLNALTGNADSTGSVTIGKYSTAGGGVKNTINGIPVSPLVNIYLALTGLLYKGGGVVEWNHPYLNECLTTPYCTLSES